MFSDLVESVASKQRTNRRWTVIVSAALQSACPLVVILIPLVYTHALPTNLSSRTPLVPFLAPPPVQTPLAHAVDRQAQSNTGVWLHVPPHFTIGRTGPMRGAPNFRISTQTSPENVGPIGFPGSGYGPVSGLGPSGPVGPSAPTESAGPAKNRIRQSSGVVAAKIVSRPDPIYPDWARRAGIQGDVVLHAIIGTDGRILELHVVSGNPALVRAALEAVRQWRYQPTLLNNEPVEVETTITVRFVLGGG